MSRISKAILSLLTAASVIATTSYAQAQSFSNSRRGIQLIEYRQRCKDGDASPYLVWLSAKSEVPIGRRIYDAVGKLRKITKDETRVVLCRIAEVGEPPRFKTLTLSMGFSKDDYYGSGRMKISVYKNGNLVDSTVVGAGEPVNFQADIAGARDVGIEFTCIEPNKGKNGNSFNFCGENFYFFDALVR